MTILPSFRRLAIAFLSLSLLQNLGDAGPKSQLLLNLSCTVSRTHLWHSKIGRLKFVRLGNLERVECFKLDIQCSLDLSGTFTTSPWSACR
ncbi:hypothetical protein R3P38DRAFT_2876473, partial [Favolaschia claudopus]